jgi:CHASE3 domain sensor protein
VTTSAPARPTAAESDPERPSWRRRVAELRELGRGTRVGRLASLAAATVALVLLAGVLALVATLRTQAASEDVVTRSGPLTAATQELYRALSDADASAGQGFLLGAGEPDSLRLRYQSDLAAAGRALAVVGSASGPDAVAGPVATLTTGVPVYAGLVETARTADRQGLTYGAAYLREASSFLRTTLLPAAQQAYDAQAAALADDQAVADGGTWTVLALVAVVAALVAIAALHRRIARTTKRRLTPGVALAGGAVGLLLVWGVIALGLGAALTASARDDGSEPNRELVAARSAVLQSRSDEVLTLVARSAGGDYEQDYVRRSIGLYGWQGLLDRARDLAGSGPVADDASTAATVGRRGIVVHELVRTLDVSGDYDEAVALALSTAPDGGQGSVQQVEDALDRAVMTTADTAASDAAGADTATTLLAVGVVLLTLVAAAGLVAGVWPRLQEYR